MIKLILCAIFALSFTGCLHHHSHDKPHISKKHHKVHKHHKHHKHSKKQGKPKSDKGGEVTLFETNPTPKEESNPIPNIPESREVAPMPSGEKEKDSSTKFSPFDIFNQIPTNNVVGEEKVFNISTS